MVNKLYFNKKEYVDENKQAKQNKTNKKKRDSK